MTPETQRWFPALEPPAGGAARLRRALDERDAGHVVWTPATAAFAAVALLGSTALPLVALHVARPDPIAAVLERLDAPAPVHVANGAALALPSARSDVEVYLVLADTTAR